MTNEQETHQQQIIGTSIGVSIDGRDALTRLIQQEGHDPMFISGAAMQDIAERLCEFAPKTGRKAKWGKDYLDNVLKGRLDPSMSLIQAVMAMLQTKTGIPDVWAKARPMQLSVTADVKPGALVAVDSRDCGFAACGRPFIPVNYFQKYCSHECREAHRELTKKK